MRYLRLETLRIRGVKLNRSHLGEYLLCDKEMYLLADNNNIIITSH